MCSIKRGDIQLAAKSLKCPKCARTFSMPGHLARHVTATHGLRLGNTRAIKRPRQSKATRPVGRPRGSGKKKVGRPRKGVAAASGGVVARLVADMRNFHNELLARRQALDGEIAGLTTAMEALGGTTPARGPRKRRASKRAGSARRGRRPSAGPLRVGSLTEHVFRALKQSTRPMSPQEITAEVVAAGFRSTAKDLSKSVSNSLAKLKRAKRVGRGMYRL